MTDTRLVSALVFRALGDGLGAVVLEMRLFFGADLPVFSAGTDACSAATTTAA